MRAERLPGAAGFNGMLGLKVDEDRAGWRWFSNEG